MMRSVPLKVLFFFAVGALPVQISGDELSRSQPTEAIDFQCSSDQLAEKPPLSLRSAVDVFSHMSQMTLSGFLTIGQIVGPVYNMESGVCKRRQLHRTVQRRMPDDFVPDNCNLALGESFSEEQMHLAPWSCWPTFVNEPGPIVAGGSIIALFVTMC